MRKLFKIKTGVVVLLLLAGFNSQAQAPVNWTPEQLMEPATLAAQLQTRKEVPVVISVGPGAVIPTSVAAGTASSTEGLTKLKEVLSTLPKEKKIVVYCGCCPFEHCPNARPAIALLKDMKFTNYYLLDLPHNVKQDWIDKGYPTTKL